MLQPNNGQAPSPEDNRLCAPKGSQARYTGELLLRTRPRTYYKIVNMLAAGESDINISRQCRVATRTIDAIQERRSEEIAERKKQIISNLSEVAELGSEKMAEKIGKVSFRDTTIGTGVAVDKILALTGQLPSTQIAVLNLPTPQDREAHQRTQDALDEIMRKLNA